MSCLTFFHPIWTSLFNAIFFDLKACVFWRNIWIETAINSKWTTLFAKKVFTLISFTVIAAGFPTTNGRRKCWCQVLFHIFDTFSQYEKILSSWDAVHQFSSSCSITISSNAIFCKYELLVCVIDDRTTFHWWSHDIICHPIMKYLIVVSFVVSMCTGSKIFKKIK